MTSDWIPLRFIDQEIDVYFNTPPVFDKRPDAPDGFHFQGEIYPITELVSSWFDFERRGKMAKNMKPPHLQTATKRGSWGVGRFYFRVRTAQDRVFDLYYDRAPRDASDRGGHWILWRELGQS